MLWYGPITLGSAQLRSGSDVAPASAVLRAPSHPPALAQRPCQRCTQEPLRPEPCPRVPPRHQAPQPTGERRDSEHHLSANTLTPPRFQQRACSCSTTAICLRNCLKRSLLFACFTYFACSSSFTPTKTLLLHVKNTPTQRRSCGNTFPYLAANGEPTQQGGHAFRLIGIKRSSSSAVRLSLCCLAQP